MFGFKLQLTKNQLLTGLYKIQKLYLLLREKQNNCGRALFVSLLMEDGLAFSKKVTRL